MVDATPIIDPQQEFLAQSARTAKKLMTKYPNLKVLIVGAAAYIGEEDPDDPDLLRNVAFLFEAPVQASTLGPGGQGMGAVALHIKPPVCAQSGLIRCLRYDQAPPFFYPRDLSPIDAFHLLDLYNQLRSAAKPAYTDTEWAKVAEDE